MAPLISPDFSEAVEFSPLPKGNYKVRITDCQTKQTKAGDTRLMWKLQTFGQSDPALNNRTITFGTMISGKGAGFLKQLIRAATGEEPTGSFNTDALLGREVLATVVEGKDQDGNPSSFPEVKAVAKLAD